MARSHLINDMNRQYYLFWSSLAIVFMIPQIFTAYAFHRLADHLDNPVPINVVKFRW